MMKEVATIKFKDAETSDDAVAIVRCDEGSVAICLSVRRGSDVEVFMHKVDAKAFLDALRTAVS
jgi:hypothetical protein